MKEQIETLIEDYKRRLRTINKHLYEKADKTRLQIKKGAYRTFISELERILNAENKPEISGIAYSGTNRDKENLMCCTSGHLIKIEFDSHNEAWKYYCKYFRYSFEEIPEDEAKKLIEHEKRTKA